MVSGLVTWHGRVKQIKDKNFIGDKNMEKKRKRPKKVGYKIAFPHWVAIKFARTKAEGLKMIKKELEKHPMSVGYMSKLKGYTKQNEMIWTKVGTYEMRRNPETNRWKFTKTH